ncbi:hypothetical protein [Macrococcus sp. DPC7161]|uniref:hypothetical protein n=1 Tax=Macrococcus sp. DPC7161 TaxID=2507060 RepID=UPI00100BF51C|nr:hypothetical protein [Macrococcus sp. DPC7161]RXK17637.1 hypothetical protein ER639_08845 [Macrococcus sp. DPC7161]
MDDILHSKAALRFSVTMIIIMLTTLICITALSIKNTITLNQEIGKAEARDQSYELFIKNSLTKSYDFKIVKSSKGTNVYK